MELSATGRVVLGMLADEPRSGYDIKALVDRSSRFFWAASYGRIYPELKQLAARGLIEPAGAAAGGRRRAVYRITTTGSELFAAWIRSPEQTHELRDEGLLKLFFAGVLGHGEARDVIRAKRERHAAELEQLRAIEPAAAASERFGPHAVLRYGLGIHEFAVSWCDEQLAELESGR